MTRQNPNAMFRPGAPLPEEDTVVEEGGAKDGLVPTWSYSSLQTFEECPHRLFLSRVKKIEQPKAEAAERGTIIHQAAEDFVRGKIDELPNELENVRSRVVWLREEFPKGSVTLEQDWGIDPDWQPTGWWDDNVWGRMKLDAFIREDESSAELWDYKSGKKFGNEIKHGGQAQTYAIGSFMRFPELEFITCRFLYTDISGDNEFVKRYTRAQAMIFLPRVTQRALAQTRAKEFPPRPSKFTCGYCPYGTQRGNGSCPWAE